ncbi:MAG: BofC C-terminal domain-containing protein [Thermoanaerobacteraceae bacterium]|nr:BofC C-terminal domain-containing protein [Thermoanaerobacteraceae bacterium]
MFTRRRNRNVLYIILPILLIAGFSISYFINYDSRDNVKQKPLVEKEQVIETAPSTKKIIEPDAKVLYERLYKSCNEIYTEEDSVSTEYVGLNEEEFARAYKGWMIRSFSPTYIQLYREEDGYCPRHYIIGEKNGYIVVFKNTTDKGLTPVQFTDILVASLRSEYQENIKKGIVVDSEERVYQILADISS